MTGMDPTLARLAGAVSDASNLESLTRPILDLLEATTGLESTYLTGIDLLRCEQHILHSRNSGDMQIPEGLTVPWEDTLCKRALDEGRPFCDDVPGTWGESAAARELGIRTYLSHPVHHTDGSLFGTLCAASSAQIRVGDETMKLLAMFAKLIAHQVERERAVAELQRSNESLSAQSLVDPLTGVANRRALMQELPRMLQTAQREGHGVQVAFIDLDGFKQINDTHGHDTGDRYLIHIARRLDRAVRAGDLVARYGGDEFVVVTSGATTGNLAERLQELITGPFADRELQIDGGGGSIGVAGSEAGETDADALLARADAAMYEIKKQRRKARH